MLLAKQLQGLWSPPIEEPVPWIAPSVDVCFCFLFVWHCQSDSSLFGTANMKLSGVCRV